MPPISKVRQNCLTAFPLNSALTINDSSDLPFNFYKKTEKSDSTNTFNNDDIAALFQRLDPNKAHDYGMTSTLILYFYYPSVEIFTSHL